MGRGTFSDRAARWLSEGELFILLLASPIFLLFRPSFAPALFLLPLFWLARFRHCRHFVPRTPVDWPVLGLLIMALTSMLITPDLEASLDKIVGLILAITIYYALVNWSRRRDSLLPAAVLLAGMAAGIALLGLVGTDWPAKWSGMQALRQYLPRMINNLPGAMSGFNSNTVSGTLITFVPLQVSLLWALAFANDKGKPRRRWLIIGVALSLVPTFLILFLAQSRAAWAALILGLVVMAGLLVKRTRWLFLALAGAGLLLLLIVGPVGISEWFVQQGWLTSSAELSSVARMERWSRWLWAIAEYPLSGIGMDVFRWAGWDMYPFFHGSFGEDLGHAHNAYLHTALDLGLVGLVCYLAVIGGILVAGWQAYKRSQLRLAQAIILGSLMGIATHATWGLVDVLPLGARTNFLWWLVVALVAAATIDQRWRQPESTPLDTEPSQSNSLSIDELVEGKEPGPS